jgi:small redox-active disulfide protein 2
MATIQILGTGCSKCGYLAANAQQAVQDAGREDVIEKVTDIVKILDFSPTALPALAINGRVVTAGTLPSRVARVDRRSTWAAQPQASWSGLPETLGHRSKEFCRCRDPGSLRTGNRGHPSSGTEGMEPLGFRRPVIHPGSPASCWIRSRAPTSSR